MSTIKKVFLVIQCFGCCVMLLLFKQFLGLDESRPQTVSMTRREFDNIMSKRTSLLSEQCKSQMTRPTIKSGEHLYLLWNKRLVWCPVFKAASTNWMIHLLYLSGLNEKDIDELR